ncbi:amino acid adenylation domain-containing protein [Actinoplanes sp. NPDC026619]|uniref:non-ribosomal peptide synthetase n=1 Tax=Actinoplanes sp. NPDC026619 TaxID=3155798 RepID=UPI0033EF4D29
MDETLLPDAVAISAKEQAQWLLHQLQPGRGVCNVGIAVRVERVLRWWPLQQALNHLVRRHPALRAVLSFDGPLPRKRFLASTVEFPLTTDGAAEESLTGLLTDRVIEPFDLGDGGLLVRAHLVLLPKASVVLLVSHHLVIDFISAGILTNELPRLYDSYAVDGEAQPELAGTGQIHLEPPADQNVIDYWIKHLDGVDPGSMALPNAHPITGRPTFAGARVVLDLSAGAVDAVARLQAQTKVTQNLILLAAFYLLLARHGAGPAVVVGIPVTGRRRLRGDVVGFHTKTLPVRVDVTDDIRVDELVQRTCWAFLEGLEHDDASFEDIQTVLASRSADWRVPLFRHGFNYRPHKEDNLEMAEVPIRVYEVHNAMSRLDMEWIFYGAPDEVELAVVYSTEVHDENFVRQLIERYEAILHEMAARLDGTLGEIIGWSESDHAADRRLSAPVRSATPPTVAASVAAWAARHPDAPAVRHQGHTTTYCELTSRASALADRLRAAGLRPGEPVALFAGRGPNLLAAALGAWAAGGVYLPLDPEHPAARLADQVADAGVRFILAGPPPPDEMAAGRHVLDIAGAGEAGAPSDDSNGDPDGAAYLIYTSGSSGRPKGVVVSHANLANLISDFAERLTFTDADRMLWLTTFSFDISALEVFLPLTMGGTVVIADDHDRIDASRLLQLIGDENVGVVQATPTTWRHVAGRLAGQLAGRRVLSGGEPLSAALADRLLADGCRLFNVYGPTETTIWSTAAELSRPVPDPVPIGGPIARTQVLVCTPEGRPVPPGVPGELWIGGAGVALGYHDRPEVTEDRFRTVPGRGRFYRTGDQVRRSEPGLIFLGRADRQVKVRGHRLELVEIEGVLEAHPGVHAAAVVTEPDDSGHLRLVAAVRRAGGEPVDDAQLRDHVGSLLPGAAVPSRIVFVDGFPMTGNDKVDHRTLARILARDGSPVELPADPALGRLVMLWREVLGDNRLGPDANFFLSGGHSLLAVTLADRLTAQFGGAIGFDTVFDAPSPRLFQAWLSTREVSR